MKSSIYFFFLFLTINSLIAQKSEILYLSGKGIDDAVEWEFYCTDGRQSGYWTTIPVPSNWELHGFGEYNYGHDKNKADEEGIYRHSFMVPSDWKKKKVEIVFVASMTDTEVKINDKLAGPVHQGGFYQFSYDISDKLRFGRENQLEVRVSKMSANESVNMAERKADYWIFGGIFRPVYLKISPSESISRIAIDARANGNIIVETYLSGINKADRIKAYVTDMSGKPIGQPFAEDISSGIQKVVLKSGFPDIESWSPEHPSLYEVHVQLINNGEIIHQHDERFGFRTVEIKARDGIYVNGEKIMFRGVNRHSFWPESGRALSKELSIKDVELMKNMNINAVRMSHYPPDPHFLHVCDSLGLFVLNELAGWQRPPYDTEVGKKLVKELVTRDVNHPSIVLWDNGNEGGWNIELDNEFAKYDPQNRAVIHPWELFRGLDTKHYRDWNYGSGTFFHGREIFFPTEFLHGLYDGGHGAGLEDWWNLMLDNPLSAGGFLWVFADEGVVRTDKEGWIDTQKSNAPDGIVGPYREKEGSFYSIKEIWSPVHINMEFIPPGFDGSINVENRFFYTNINECNFEATLYKYKDNSLMPSGELTVDVPDVVPGNRGIIHLSLPENWKEKYHILELISIDPHGREIMTWSWPIKTPGDFSMEVRAKKSLTGAKSVESESQYILSAESASIYISKNTGLIDSVSVGEINAGLSNGPVLTHSESKLKSIEYRQAGGHSIVLVNYEEGLTYLEYDLHPNGCLKIEYNHNLQGAFDYAGINFNFPEEKVKQVNMLADGPYRVYKNRMKGPQFGYWEKEYNNTVTGESWDYPEFKGFYSNFYWAEFLTDGIPFYVCTDTEDMYLRLFTPEDPEGAYNENTDPVFPEGDISFMDAISPIGTKFKKASQHGPMGQKNELSKRRDDERATRVIYFYFGQ